MPFEDDSSTVRAIKYQRKNFIDSKCQPCFLSTVDTIFEIQVESSVKKIRRREVKKALHPPKPNRAPKEYETKF